ncbi:nitroreductase family deazaflavin-dependent oxidoreductase [Saccharopolyspora sp. MS10]|uniref:nitroreductase family deazaflavin-dependent oxidoreductase n=1 Tax=Saccharopolyspora sp. MS10 TaxID=3385973 RepID=UPI0039A3D252
MTEPAPPPANALARAGARLLRNRTLMRAPIWLFRARLGFLLGSRLLMLEHVGRRTGARRRVVLEVIGHPSPDVYLVASGFGTRSQWFRNLEAHPGARISAARHRSVPVIARRLSTEEAAVVLTGYARRHARAWARLKGAVETTLGAEIDVRDPALPVVELRLTPPRAP